MNNEEYEKIFGLGVLSGKAITAIDYAEKLDDDEIQFEFIRFFDCCESINPASVRKIAKMMSMDGIFKPDNNLKMDNCTLLAIFTRYVVRDNKDKAFNIISNVYTGCEKVLKD